MSQTDCLRYTLLAEGSSDRALMPILNWLIRHIAGEVPLEPQWADRERLQISGQGLSGRIHAALDHYPCELLFVHRDSDAAAPQSRLDEAGRAFMPLSHMYPGVRFVGVVPVRMTETWLLTSEPAIRRAAGNPLGRAALHLPKLNRLEKESSPKQVLKTAIQTASELCGRRLKKLNVARAAHDVAEFTPDFHALLQLPAFQQLSDDLRAVLF